MNRFRLKIGEKVLGGFGLLIIIFIGNAVFSFLITQRSADFLAEATENINPTQDAVATFKQLVIESKMYSTNWVYLIANDQDKELLKEIQSVRYPALKESFVSLVGRWDSQKQVDLLDSIFLAFEQMQEIEQEIMATLVTFEDYQNPIAKFTTEDLIENEILPRSEQLLYMLDNLEKIKEDEAKQLEVSLLQSFRDLQVASFISSALTLILGLTIAFIMTRAITKPINRVREALQKLSKGEFVEISSRQLSNDEIGDMERAVEETLTGLKAVSDFALQVGNGNFDTEFSPLSSKDALGNALIEMRANLKEVAEEEKRRAWVTTGLARFNEVVRKSHESLEDLCDDIIKELVRYIKGNQGAIFIVNTQDDKEDVTLTMASCYAMNRKKFLEKTILPGEGLVGQCFLEKEPILLTEIPNGYARITSGLGEGEPRCLLVVPMKVRENITGVIEVASFNEFSEEDMNFVGRVAEIFASTIISVKVNERTKALLQASQQQSEELRAQEEEMRQNMEELQATQEAMRRNQFELKDANDRFDLINQGTSEGLWDIDLSSGPLTDKSPLWFSSTFQSILGESGKLLGKTFGSWYQLIHPEDQNPFMDGLMHCLRSKLTDDQFDFSFRLKIEQETWHWFSLRGAIKRNEGNAAVRIAGSLKDIHSSKAIEAQLKAAKFAEEVLSQGIALRDEIIAMNTALAFLDGQANIQDPNSFFAKLFDLKHGIKVSMADLLQDNSQKDFEKVWSQVQNGQSFVEQKVIQRENLPDFWIQFSIIHLPANQSDQPKALFLATEFTNLLAPEHQRVASFYLEGKRKIATDHQLSFKGISL